MSAMTNLAVELSSCEMIFLNAKELINHSWIGTNNFSSAPETKSRRETRLEKWREVCLAGQVTFITITEGSS